MAGYDRKIKRTQEKKRKRETYWEDLMNNRAECIESYMRLHTLLNTMKEKYKEDIDANTELKQAVIGANDTFIELAGNIKDVMSKHMTEDEEKKDDNGKPILIPRTGKVNKHDDEYLDYINIENEYLVVLNNLASFGANSIALLLDKLSVFVKQITKEDVELVKSAIAEASKEAQEATNPNNIMK